MKTYEKEETYVQIDVKAINTNTVVCNLYTGLLCAEIHMKRDDYEYLLASGFFNRAHDKNEKDSAGIIATTEVYKIPNLTVTA